ncbi:MAG: histidine kinase [Acidobacteriota bacterium]|nr:histidine kinase [Acidobacteriota bacterium]
MPEPIARRIGRTVLIGQLVAIPVSLVMTAVDDAFAMNLLIASIYSHTIGLSCMAGASVVVPRFPATDGWRSRLVITVQFFVCGAAGAEVARRLCAFMFPESFKSEQPVVSWAIGATIAVIVGFVLATVRHLRARVLSTELEALQARINPHFLFNTLNSIAALIREDPQRAEAMTLQLSALFRYTLQAPRAGLVTLEEELTIVEGYLAIEQERLGDRLSCSVEVEPGLRGVRVPPLFLQPVVENAIKHGVATSVGGGSVRVRAWQDSAVVHITVDNTGIGEGRRDGIGEGISNVRERLRRTFGKSAALTLRHGDAGAQVHISFAPGVSP